MSFLVCGFGLNGSQNVFSSYIVSVALRHGGLSVLQKLVARAGDASGGVAPGGKMVLEALLPHKETILKQVRACLRDSESRVTALASDILSSMAWWP